MEPRETLITPKWLVYGQGFGLIVLALSLALTPLAISYTQSQGEQKRFFERKIVVLTALRSEARENLRNAGLNIESAKDATRQRVTRGTLTFPGFVRYTVIVWNGLSGSQELLSLPADDFSALALIYGQLEDANRRYTAWEDRFTLSPFSFSSLSESQWSSWEQYRNSEVKNLRIGAEAIEGNLPLVIKVSDLHVKRAEIELKLLSLETWPFGLLVQSNYITLLVLGGILIVALVRGIQRRREIRRERARWEGWE
jgi:hypothetical protein